MIISQPLLGLLSQTPPPPFSTYAIPDFAAFVLAKERSHSLADRRDKGGHPVVKEIVFYGQMHISFLPNRFKTNLTLGGETLWWQGNAAKMKVVHKSDMKCAEFPFFFTEQCVFIGATRWRSG